MQVVPSEYLEIDRKSRRYIPYLDLDQRDPKERVCDFDDVIIPMDPERAMFEASRCIHCPDPAACVIACPANNDIPSAMWLIEQGLFAEAAKLYRQTSSLPEVCSRVCPHEDLCQGSCVLNKHEEPVLCGALEAFVTCYDRKFEGVEIPKGTVTNKKVAIVGAGPAGMGCAEQLIRMGHDCTIFDAKPAGGGLLTYGIPNFKLPKEVVNELLSDLTNAGVEFVYNTYIGKDKTIESLLAEGYDAVFVGIGTGIDAKMEVPGEDIPGVHEATEFLIRANVAPEQLPEGLTPITDVGKKLVVIGGGDTASDCLRSAVRLGAEEVVCLYRRTENEMPGGVKDRRMAKEEGADYQFLTQPLAFTAGEDGKLNGVECIRMELGEPDSSGRRRPVRIEGSEFFVEADLAVLALGYWPDPEIGESTPDMETHNWGLILTDKVTGATSKPGVFAGGDAVTGPDLVVTAMAAGRRAANAIDTYLREQG